MEEKRYLTVYALTKYIKRKFDRDPHLQQVMVKGEISNFKRHSSGHMYFTLKDEKSRILAVMFSRYNQTMKFVPENGMNVLITGDLSLYEASGQYQIYVKEMTPDGIGDLYLAYEQLKQKLEKEGLFSEKYKQPIPKYPKAIGLITSPTGAAIRDMITTLKRRYPSVPIYIYPALVQGKGAAPSITQQINRANERKEVDVLIVGRGGGSIEELWAFNEEEVIRGIFASSIPIISAVGHETDFTIADFVADLRAPTPTGAAELSVPHIDDLSERIHNQQARMIRATRERLTRQFERLHRVEKSYAFRYPQKLYEQKLEQVDRTKEQLIKSTIRLLKYKQEQVDQQRKRLLRTPPHSLAIESRKLYIDINKRLRRSMNVVNERKQREFSHLISKLETLSPLKIMDRGYSLLYSEKEELIKSIHQVKQNDEIKVKVKDGAILAEVKNIIDNRGEK
ncbi:exodeoxyribonuclease VII large subunit [Cytobacillus kochii]|uniref:exodeoxyribonuclease VII large subunit n=1 Tax=Cytobacillus kochii TaxID=859143 RepID=UPI003850DAF3